MLSLNIVLTLCFLFRFITIIIFFTSPLNEFAPDAAKRGFYRAANSIFWPGGDWAYRLRRSRPSSDYYWCLARSSKRMDGWMDNASDCVLGRILLALNKFYN